MNDATIEIETAGFEAWVGVSSFDADRGERLEALASMGRGPMRLAASTLVALDARRGRWKRPDRPAVGPASEAPPPPEPTQPEPTQPQPNPANASKPARASAPAKGPAKPSRAASRPTTPAGAPARKPATEAAAPPEPTTRATTTRATTRAPRRRADRAAPAFPADLAKLADQQGAGAGVGEDDAWNLWVSSNDTTHEEQLAELDRAPGRVERAEEGLQRARQALNGPRRRIASATARVSRSRVSRSRVSSPAAP